MCRLVVSTLLASVLWAGAVDSANLFDVLHGTARKKPASRVAVKADGWPDTPAAAVAKRWLKAFAAGDDAMRAFYRESLTPESLARRGVDERLESARQLRERFGSLTLASVDVSTPTSVEASLLTAEHQSVPFIFTVGPKPPHRLVSVSYRDRRTIGH